MIKKTVLLVAVALFVLSLSPAEAQIRDETVLTYEVLSQEWENLIAGVLDLSGEEAAALWPLYRE